MLRKLVIATCLVGAMWGLGCYSPKRDLSIDPYNKPLVHFLPSAFDPQTATVQIRWEYIGGKAVKFFQVERREGLGFVELSQMPGKGNETEYITIASFQDSDIVAGESLQYRVVANLDDGSSVFTETLLVPVPGAFIERILRDPVHLSVQVQWAGDAQGVAGYDIIRQVEDSTAAIAYQTNDANASTFTDLAIGNNFLHTYTVRTRFTSGVALDSRPRSAQFYRLGTTQPVNPMREGTDYMRVGPGDSEISGSLLALIGRPQLATLYQLNYVVGVSFDGTPRVLRTLVGTVDLDIKNLLPATLAIAGPPFGGARGPFPRIFVGGTTDTGRVNLVGYDLPLFNRTWTAPSGWAVAPGGRVGLARDAQNRLYASAGNTLRVFTDQGTQIGALTLPGSNPSALAVFDGVLWVTWPDQGRIDRGQLTFSGSNLTDITWQPVGLNAGAKPTGVAVNAYGQVFVLDVGRREIVGLQADGSPLLTWSLPADRFDLGDVAVDASGLGLVQVSNGRGDVLTYVP